MTPSDAEKIIKQAGAALYAGQFDQALALAQPLADASQAGVSVTALQIMSLALTRLGRPDAAEEVSRRLLKRDPGNAAAWANLSAAQEAADRIDQAIDSLTRALQIDPKRAPLHLNLGRLHVKRQDWAQAELSFARAIDLAPERPEPYCQRAEALIDLNRCIEAQRVLEAVLKQHPSLARGWCLLGAAHQKLGQTQQALACYRKAEELSEADPLTQAAAHASMATLIKDQNLALALEHARRAVELQPDLPGVQSRLAGLLMEGGQYDEAREIAQRVLARHGNDPFMRWVLTWVSAKQCDWRMCDDQLSALKKTLHEENNAAFWATFNPFGLLCFQFDLAELRQVTEAFVGQFGLPQPMTPEMRALHIGQPRPQKLRIGYFSADFHNHATMYLMAGMFDAHDRSRFETIGICYGVFASELPDDLMRQRAKRTFDRFISVAGKTASEIAQLARDLDIHIAVDLKGFTRGNRLDAFVQRVAPIQMHYLGYPGTLGMSKVIDYLIADRVLIPESSRPFYAEKIIELPDSYQVNDRQRAIAPVVPSRAELGLPQDGFVFCCFNNNFKITSDLFQLWMQLLQARPGSVLWLFEDNATAAANLRAAAIAAGVDANRLIFAQRAPLPEHLARHAQADLFLDTLYYNAHTTASDALWAGLPVLTCAGQTFASRVAASLLTACGLPELITHSHREYLDLALALALSADPTRLKALRQRLQSTRLQVPLFDTERFTRHIERAYDLAWDRFQRGLPPDHIVVPSIELTGSTP